MFKVFVNIIEALVAPAGAHRPALFALDEKTRVSRMAKERRLVAADLFAGEKPGRFVSMELITV